MQVPELSARGIRKDSKYVLLFFSFFFFFFLDLCSEIVDIVLSFLKGLMRSMKHKVCYVVLVSL